MSHPDQRRIDVWLFDGDSSRLALLFAYLMTEATTGGKVTIRVLAPAPTGSAKKSKTKLRKRLGELRIDAAAVDTRNGSAMFEASADASSMLIPLSIEGMSTLNPEERPANELFAPPPTMAMIAASGNVKLTPDENNTGD